jgi:phosphatidylserine/phosphatidylglycerophosphate/cardiolipin synthase-like enzyme
MKKYLAFAFLLLTFELSALAGTQLFFSPKGGCTDAIVKQIGLAAKTIDIMMYSFSSRPIIQALDKAKERGVTVRVLLDKGQETQKYAKGRYLAARGIAVKYDTGRGLMHNKVGIFDGQVMFTGSFNWTAQAEKNNAENLLLIDDPGLIKQYQARFDQLWTTGQAAGLGPDR